MKKRLAIGMITTMVLSTGVAMASPAAELEEGKWNVNIGASVSPDMQGGDGDEVNLDTSLYGGITYGISDKWGVQVDYSHYGTEVKMGNIIEELKIDATEFNVLYKLNPYLNAYVGYVYAGMNMEMNFGQQNGMSMIGSMGTHTDGFQAGLMGWYPLGDKVKTFGKVGIGDSSRVYELGFSYAVSEKWDIDLSYRDAEYKDLAVMGQDIDIEFDGVRLGLSTSF